MTGTNCDLFTHNQSRSYLNHLVYRNAAPFSHFRLSLQGNVVTVLRNKPLLILVKFSLSQGTAITHWMPDIQRWHMMHQQRHKMDHMQTPTILTAKYFVLPLSTSLLHALFYQTTLMSFSPVSLSVALFWVKVCIVSHIFYLPPLFSSYYSFLPFFASFLLRSKLVRNSCLSDNLHIQT
jgi:hypothetical protein